MLSAGLRHQMMGRHVRRYAVVSVHDPTQMPNLIASRVQVARFTEWLISLAPPMIKTGTIVAGALRVPAADRNAGGQGVCMVLLAALL